MAQLPPSIAFSTVSPRLQQDWIIVGGGLVGLATAMALHREFPNQRITVLEQAEAWGAHQSSHNSGVIHAGVYYPPGSLKAQLCRRGAAEMKSFCLAHGIEVKEYGKWIVATTEEEESRLDTLFQTAKANGVELQRVSPGAVQDQHPIVQCKGGLWVKETALVSYPEVANVLARELAEDGVQCLLNRQVQGIHQTSQGIRVSCPGHEDLEGKFLITCGGLWSDRLIRLSGLTPPGQIVPFRGEYYALEKPLADGFHGLVYPMPNPKLPFLGVHLTETVDGRKKIGPNAVLSLSRSGYEAPRFDLTDVLGMATFPGLYQFALTHMKTGLGELLKSGSKSWFARQAKAMVPELTPQDLGHKTFGIRAQWMAPNGKLVSDFLFLDGPRMLHVCNAPSPAATASLAIGHYIVERIKGRH